jgi:hypothetical protein
MRGLFSILERPGAAELQARTCPSRKVGIVLPVFSVPVKSWLVGVPGDHNVHDSFFHKASLGGPDSHIDNGKKTDEQFKNVSKNQQNEHHILALLSNTPQPRSGGFISFFCSSYKYFSAFSLVSDCGGCYVRVYVCMMT